jgi:hypothetical protein
MMRLRITVGACLILMLVAFVAWDSQHFCEDVWFPVRCVNWSDVEFP